ncbi:MAG: hypothetical protein KBG20_18390 [Caldilineaceae bacterium]|nr:hypothetical protein [Caldilineaceae bacterium]MBP8107980.1 hypothetical protein [Caldilineaceae bacterium]MBP8123855.1 hypothetical protein [Caldilineaceae bacterium]MBP9074282.1 hypothetical protein [Caldilineaceae bacterium]
MAVTKKGEKQKTPTDDTRGRYDGPCLPGLAGKFDRTDPVSRDHPGQKSRHKNSHGYAIRTRGYRGQLKLVFEDLAVERQARILDDDLHRDDFCHFYASLVKLYERWD